MVGDLNVHKVILEDINEVDWKVPELNRGNRILVGDMSEKGVEMSSQILEKVSQLEEGEALVIWCDI